MAVTTMMNRSCTGVHRVTASIKEVAQLPVRLRLSSADGACGGFREAMNFSVNVVARRICPRLLPVPAAKICFKHLTANTLTSSSATLSASAVVPDAVAGFCSSIVSTVATVAILMRRFLAFSKSDFSLV